MNELFQCGTACDAQWKLLATFSRCGFISPHLVVRLGEKAMGHHSQAKMLGKIPTYYVSEVVKEDAGSGNVRIWNYARKNGVLVPEFEVIIASTKLLTIGRSLSEYAQEIFNSEQIRGPGMKVH